MDVIGKTTESVQVQLKDHTGSMSFTVKNISLKDAYSNAFVVFKAMSREEGNGVTLTLYKTKNKKEILKESDN